MRGATAPRLLLEVVCARLLLPSASDTESALLQRVERIEARLDMSIPASDMSVAARPAEPTKTFSRRSQVADAPAPAPAAAAAAPVEARPEPQEPPPAAPSPPPVRPPEDPVVGATATTPPPVAGAPNAAAVRSMWTTVREKVRQRSRTIDVMLAGAIVRGVHGDTLVLSHESAPLARRLVEQRNSDVIREALKDALGVDWKIQCEAGGGPAPVVAEPVRPANVAAPRPPEDDEESMLAEVVHEGRAHVGTPRRPRSNCCRTNSGRVASRAASHARQRREKGPAYADHHGRSGSPPSLPRSSSLTARTWCS